MNVTWEENTVNVRKNGRYPVDRRKFRSYKPRNLDVSDDYEGIKSDAEEAFNEAWEEFFEDHSVSYDTVVETHETFINEFPEYFDGEPQNLRDLSLGRFFEYVHAFELS